MFHIYINDEKTENKFKTLNEAVEYIKEKSSEFLAPTGFSRNEFYDSSTLTYYNILEEKD